MEELRSPDASINKVGQIIVKDLGMTTKILQLVNSAFFGIPRHISSPEQAASLLGLDTVKALVLTLGVFSKFEKTKLPGFSIKKLWTHSIACGAYSKEIAKAENIENDVIDDAFMAGLLHDVGKLVLASSFSDKLIEVINLSRDPKLNFYESEYQILGTTHAEVGAYLLGLWGLPNPIIEAVAFHHRPHNFPGENFNPLAAVHVANALEHEKNTTSADKNRNTRLDHEYLGKLGLNDHLDTWREIYCQVKQEALHDG
jgi:HD-like signal output (HDOD) protein